VWNSVAWRLPVRFLLMPRTWLWGLALGVVVGVGVVLLSYVRYGFSAPLLLLGVVLVVAFGALGVVGAFVGRRTHLD
jgi:hypothetical protein